MITLPAAVAAAVVTTEVEHKKNCVFVCVHFMNAGPVSQFACVPVFGGAKLPIEFSTLLLIYYATIHKQLYIYISSRNYVTLQ